jgi:hypothetical protein
MNMEKLYKEGMNSGIFFISLFLLPKTKKGEAEAPPEIRSRRLILCGGFGLHIHAPPIFVEIDFAVHQREERPIAARADILARFELRAALPDDDAAGGDGFSAKFLHAEPFADAVAAVADAALTFLVCHK